MVSTRIDKWLWAARFYKTRSQAGDAVNGGHVRVNDVRCKSSRAVQLEDKIRINKNSTQFIVLVKQLSVKRGSAPQAQQMYEETEQSLQHRELTQAQRKLNAMANPRPQGRPDKRQRRQLKKWREIE